MKKTWFIVVVALALVLSSCNFPFAQASESVLATSVAQTVEALESEVKVPELAIPTLMPTLALPTVAPVATMTAVPTKAPDPCLYATYVTETIADNTEMSPGESFTKTWTMKNTGTCDWNKDYKIVFKSGNKMSGPDKQSFGEEIDPGETIKISLDLVAPSDDGTYKGYWWFETNKGVKFGENGVSVKIVVK